MRIIHAAAIGITGIIGFFADVIRAAASEERAYRALTAAIKARHIRKEQEQ